METVILKSQVAVATHTLKSVNQDCGLARALPESSGTVLAIADGLGSFHQAEIASAFAVKKAVEELALLTAGADLDFDQLFETIQAGLQEISDNASAHKGPCLGTTLICVMESSDRYQIAYLGNGAIFHIRGDFNHFSDRVFLPWNSVNLLNPHTREEGGKNAMYKLLSPYAKPHQIRPQVLEIYKDDIGPGEIIMVCTDGIYSADEVPVGKDSEGKIWISGEESMELFYRHLSSYFRDEGQDLDGVLKQYLAELEKKQLIYDDCTLGVIISPQTIKYHQQNRS